MSELAGSNPDEIQRKIAAALAALVPDDPSIPPHPYLRRHLAEHAAEGHVLDDEHVPPALLAWESSSEVRRLLAADDSGSERQQWLQSWARIELFARHADPVSRLTSMQLACHAADPGRQAQPSRGTFDASPVTPLWNDCASPSPAWTSPPHVIVSLAPVDTGEDDVMTVAAGDRKGSLRILRRDGSPAHTPLEVHQGAVTHLMPLRGGLVVTAGTDGRVCVVDAVHSKLVQEVIPRRERTWVSSLALYRSESHLPLVVAAFSDGYTIAFDTGRFLPRALSLPQLEDSSAVLCGLEPPDSRPGLLFSQHDTVFYFDGVTAVARSQHTARVRAVVGLPQPGWYAVADEAGMVSLHDVTSHHLLAPAIATARHAPPVTALNVTWADGQSALASAAGDGSLCLWSIPSLRRMGSPLSAHTAPVTAVASMGERGKQRLLTAGEDRLVHSWTMDEQTFRRPPQTWTRISATALSDPPHLLAAARASRIVAYNTTTGKQQTLIKDQSVSALAWPRVNGELLLAAALDDFDIVCINPMTRARTGPVLTGHYLPVLAMVPVAGVQGDLVASAGADGRVCVWDLRTGRMLADFGEHKLSVRCLATHLEQGRQMLASGGSDGSVRIWDVARLEQHGKTIRADQGIINDVAFVQGHDRQLLIASAGQDGSLKLWDAGTAEMAAEMSPGDGQLGAVTSLGLPGSRTVLATAGTTAIHLWDAAADRDLLQIVTGWPVRTLKTVRDHSAADSSVLLASGEAGTLTFRLHHERL